MHLSISCQLNLLIALSMVPTAKLNKLHMYRYEILYDDVFGSIKGNINSHKAPILKSLYASRANILNTSGPKQTPEVNIFHFLQYVLLHRHQLFSLHDRPNESDI